MLLRVPLLVRHLFTACSTFIHGHALVHRPYSAEEEGCGALWNLAATETNEEAIASNDGIEAVVVAMRTHVAVAGVQEQGYLRVCLNCDFILSRRLLKLSYGSACRVWCAP